MRTELITLVFGSSLDPQNQYKIISFHINHIYKKNYLHSKTTKNDYSTVALPNVGAIRNQTSLCLVVMIFLVVVWGIQHPQNDGIAVCYTPTKESGSTADILN